MVFPSSITLASSKRKGENLSKLGWESLDFQNFIHYQFPTHFLPPKRYF